MDWTLVHVACWEATPRQSITAGEGEEEAPAINPGGSARGLLDEEGLDKQSATTFSVPGMCWMSDVNSATKERWRHCLAVQASVERDKAYVRGLWSVKMVKLLPSKMKRKWRIPAKQAHSSPLHLGIRQLLGEET